MFLIYNCDIYSYTETNYKVAWIDGDSFFSNEDWVNETSLLLEEYLIVQPFAYLVRLPPGADWIDPADINVTTIAHHAESSKAHNVFQNSNSSSGFQNSTDATVVKAADVVAVTQLYRSAGYVRVTQGRNAQKRSLINNEVIEFDKHVNGLNEFTYKTISVICFMLR